MNRLKVKELKEMTKSKGKKILEILEKKRRILVCFVLYMSVQMNTIVCYAATKTKTTEDAKGTDVVKSLNNLEVLVTAIISAVGAVILAKNVMEFASAYQQADSSGMNTAVKGIVGGFLMFSIGSVLTFLGVTA